MAAIALTRDTVVVGMAVAAAAAIVGVRLRSGGLQVVKTNLAGTLLTAGGLTKVVDLGFKMAGLLVALVAANFFVLGPAVSVVLDQRQLVKKDVAINAYKQAAKVEEVPPFVITAIDRLGAPASPAELDNFAKLRSAKAAAPGTASVPAAASGEAGSTSTTAQAAIVVPDRGFPRNPSQILRDRCSQAVGAPCSFLPAGGGSVGTITPAPTADTADDLDLQALCAVRPDLVDALAPGACASGGDVSVISRVLVLAAALDAKPGPSAADLLTARTALAAARYADDHITVTNSGRSAATGVRIVAPNGWENVNEKGGCMVGSRVGAKHGTAEQKAGQGVFKGSRSVTCGGFTLEAGGVADVRFVTVPGAPPPAEVSVDPGSQTGIVSPPLIRTICFALAALLLVVIVNDLTAIQPTAPESPPRT